MEAAVLISALFCFSIDFCIVLVGGQSARSASGREGVLSVGAAEWRSGWLPWEDKATGAPAGGEG